MRINSILGKGVARAAMMVLLAACAPVVVAPTETPTTEPRVTATETPELTSTKLLTRTVILTSTPYPTYTPPPIPYHERLCGPYSFSPYAEWVAWTVCLMEANGYPRLRAENFDETIVWDAEYRLSPPIPDIGFDPVKWSMDGKHLYFRIHSGGDGSYSL